MASKKEVQNKAIRRALRVRSKLNKGKHPRVSVFKSLNQIYAQVIDDNAGNTIISCSSLELKDLSGDKVQVAHQVGKELAKRASEKGINQVIFDRGSFLYHGRIKALADGLREGGLQV